MNLIEWRDDFAVGVPSVDHDHQQIITMINVLYKEMQDRDDVTTVEEFLGDIFVGISAHFADEERVMRQARYGEFDAHKEYHEALLDSLRELMDTVDDDPREGLRLLRNQLSEWFALHFRTFDARLHRQL